ncbi:hypothetical protein WJX72_007603 [[Myrmecia] bisecta]|uniref:DUF2415 domain-containing protein n=1 Tax=[Myrmecia] bisecta TaxID=41462 RepID=A0AAW1P460_9CHLO
MEDEEDARTEVDADVDLPQAAYSSESDDDDDFVEFEEDPEEAADTTAEQLLLQGRDMQGIPWERLQFSRQRYRETRLKQYVNYTNMREAVERAQGQLNKDAKKPTQDEHYYSFHRNARAVRSTIVHFQLRNLVWATSKHDIYVMHENCINHWSEITRKTTKVLDLSGETQSARAPGLGRVQISTLCVRHHLVAAGGFQGELVVKNLRNKASAVACSCQVTHDVNGITNAIEIFDHAGDVRLMTCNNDSMVRIFDGHTFQCLNRLELPWAVNYASACPTTTQLLAVVGDDPEACLVDARNSRVAAHLRGHLDYSFAAAWHPDGHLLATGNQDVTTRLWDVRYPGRSLAVLKGCMGAIRSLRFSPDGRFLCMTEPADFVHVFDVHSNFDKSQLVDIFGEISGVAFSPQSDRLYVGVADLTYSSLLQFDGEEG